ncbi:glycoside hydrolase family 9 protein [Haloferula sargassicola]|uniref:Uncharacterized protein n=1 Tax=Haloferula sargassicola TaxID=490096 RepID=A0ABP9UMM5_9BACT
MKCFLVKWTRVACCLLPVLAARADFDEIEGVEGRMPTVGASAARFVTPELIEISHINSTDGSGVPTDWNLVENGSFVAPPAASCEVTLGGSPLAHTIAGFRRRPLYAPLAETDLRVDNRLFLTLAQPVAEGTELVVTTEDWGGSGSTVFHVTLDPDRRSAAIHVNHEGYATSGPKQAMVGYYLGSLGELEVAATSFSVVSEADGSVAFTGSLTVRPDVGYTYQPAPYQEVMQADFSALETPGVYRLKVDGLGVSLPFRIDDDMVLGFARHYLQGLYNQRCGHAVSLPFSRHVHAACHTAPAAIPTADAAFDDTWSFISAANSDASGPAPRLVSAATQLYPILRSGPIDVSGGHHDAGDYSKYTINSAQLIHHLAFIADAAPATAALDNLGIPESGNGKSDLLEEAKIEADFLAKMQDDDGGFFFLVYPQHRKYEDDVLPDEGDPQVVWPKNTAATAAAVGALADLGSSPVFQAQFPAEAALYLQKAQAGWNFLLAAIAEHGFDGSYQKLTHYGDVFGHRDELAWAAAAMFAATGDPVCQQKLIEWYDPASPTTRRWSWWALFEGYGCASRSYAFAARTGKRQPAEMDAACLAGHEQVLAETGAWRATLSGQGAYGSCLDPFSKQQSTAGWLFCSERAFDITVAHLLSPTPAYRTAVIGNANYEFGCNPIDVSYVTGTGWRRQREIVHQYAQNDDRILPPSGIPLGSIQSGFAWTARYGSQLGGLTFPGDGLAQGKYPFYDRWGDAFNTTTEFVVPQQARSLASLAVWAAEAPGADTAWTTLQPQISLPADYVLVGQPVTAEVSCPGIDLSDARVTWEWGGADPWIGGAQCTFTPDQVAPRRLEAEVVLPDGRRLSAARAFGVRSVSGGDPHAPAADTVALYHFDESYEDSSGNDFDLTAQGKVSLAEFAAGWMNVPAGKAVRFHGMGDALSVAIPGAMISADGGPSPLSLEARICVLNYDAYGNGSEPLMALVRSWNSKFGALQDIWVQPARPFIQTDALALVGGSQWQTGFREGEWQHLKITRDAQGHYECLLDGAVIASGDSTEGPFGSGGTWTLTLGNFDGYLDEVRITGTPAVAPPEEPGDPEPGDGDGDGDGGGASTGENIRPFALPFETDSDTIALYHFDGNYDDSSGNGFHLAAAGGVTRVPSFDENGGSQGEVARLSNFGDSLSAMLPDSLVAPGSVSQPLTMEMWIFPRAYKVWGNGTSGNFSLRQNWDSSLAITEDKWLQPAVPSVVSGATTVLPQSSWESYVGLNAWHHLMLTRDEAGVVSFVVDGETVSSVACPNAYGRVNDWLFRIADIDADIDEVRISSVVRQPLPPDAFEADANTIALYHFDGNLTDAGPHALDLTAGGNVSFTSDDLAWMNRPSGQAVRFSNMGDQLTVTIPDSLLVPGNSSPELTVEARILPRAYKAWGIGVASIFRLYQNWDSSFGVMQDKWLTPDRPTVMAGSHTVFANDVWDSAVTAGQWQHLKITNDAQGVVSVWVDEVLVAQQAASFAYGRTNDWVLTIGNIDADIDEVRISNIVR